MNEEPTRPADTGKTGAVAGERLAEVRRARNVSLGEIARELHLDEVKVRALEQNDFERLGAAVFVKGYLRKYASLVGLSGDDVLADYERLQPTDTAPPIVGVRTRPRQRRSAAPWIAAVAVAGITALGAWWWFAAGTTPERAPAPAGATRSPEPAGPETAEDTPALEAIEEGDAPTDTAAGQLEAPDAAPPQPAAGGEQTLDETAATEPEQSAGEPATATGHVALELSFTGDCWTEVTDASGNRLYFGLGSDGRTVAVEGEPPLQVLLGDSENVRVTVDGAPYTIPRAARRGDTARFTVTP